jgi:two-component system alkaline phosphatase synthesis response regulator PhoP
MEPALVLIADDEPFILRSLAFVLKKEGFRVETAGDGVEALEKVRASRPRVVFLDIMMPRMNGYEVCSQVKADPRLRDTHVVFLTAKGQQIDKVRGLIQGADDYITKPFSPRAILQKVREVIGGSRQPIHPYGS